MKIRQLSIITLFLALGGCSSEQPPPPNPTGTQVALAEASYSVSKSIVHLSEIAQAAHPMPAMDPAPNPSSYGMAQQVSIDWSGPVEPLLKQLANASGYRLRTIGAKPGIPVLVTIYDKNVLLADVVRDVGYQSGRRATIVIFPDTRVLELRYSKN